MFKWATSREILLPSSLMGEVSLETLNILAHDMKWFMSEDEQKKPFLINENLVESGSIDTF